MTKKIVQYEMLEGSLIVPYDKIEVKVNEFIEKGWQPYGTPFMGINIYDSKVIYQAMVKYEENSDDTTPANL